MLNTENNETANSLDGNADTELVYDPDRLLDAMLEHLKLKNDAALSRALEVAPPVISKIRHRRIPVGAAILIRMHEVSGLTIRDLRYLLGDRRKKFRVSLVSSRFSPSSDGESM
jgi:hypothetical protein